jgi:hypothetical protein
MRFVLALVVVVCLAGVAMADIPRPPLQRLSAPGGWCAGLMGGLAMTLGGLWLARLCRRK